MIQESSVNKINQLNFNQNSSITKDKIEISFLNVVLLLYLFRSAVPQFKYPFALIFIGFLCYCIMIYRNKIISSIKDYASAYYLILILFVLLVLSLIFSNKLYLSVFKEATETIVILSLFFILTLVISSKSKLDLLLSGFITFTLVFSIFIAVINTYVFYEIQNFYGFYPTHDSQNKYILSSLLLDKNFALLPIFFGFIIILYKFSGNVSKLEVVVYNILLLFFSLNIILSSSRRGLIILFLIILVLFLLLLFQRFLRTKMLIFKRLISNITIYYLSLVIFPVFAFLFIAYGSYDFKVGTLKILGIKDITSAKRAITSTMFNHFSRFNKVLPYANFNQILWSTNFDPKDPDNGWGFGYYKTIFPLVGRNSEIVPEGSKGYLLDNSCTYGYSPLHAYSNTFIGKSKVDDHEIVGASVYCFVSSDFNGDKVCLRADGSTYGKRVSEYDLKSKGKWQFLSLSASCNKGDAPVALYFNKLGVTDFYSLNGFVIFAYPLYKISDNAEYILSLNYLFGESNMETKFKHYFKIDFPNKYYLLLDKLTTGVRISSNDKLVYFSERNRSPVKSSFFDLADLTVNKVTLLVSSLTFTASIDSVYKDPDLFRNWIKNIFREDTSYYETHAKLKVDTIVKFFVDDRLSRWEFALQIYTKEYSWSERIFGGGFKFLNWYGYNFLNDKSKTDYPHNPFLYILLYSGVIGLLIYLFFLYRTFYYYIRYFKIYPLFFVFFLLTFYFTFFSGGNPFDPPIMGFFVILPFFIHSIHKKDKTESIKI